MDPERPPIGYAPPQPQRFRFTLGVFGLIVNVTAIGRMLSARLAAAWGWGPRMSGALTTALLTSMILGVTGPVFSAAWRRRPRAVIAPSAILIGIYVLR